MPLSCAVYLLLASLAPLAGCQLLSRDNANPPSNGPTSPPPTASNKSELPPEAAAEACRATAESLEKAGKDAEAIALYEKARQAGSHRYEISRRLAVLYDRQGDFNKATNEYRQLLQKNPKDADLLNDFGYCYYSQGKWAEAETQLRRALSINPKHPRAWVNLGMTLAQMHKTEDSLEAFRKVVSPAQAYSNLAFILTTQGKFDDAKAVYRQALALDPELALARAALAKLETSPPRAPAPVGSSAPTLADTLAPFVERIGPVQ
jgi:Tfp pilus assembly protein PilF